MEGASFEQVRAYLYRAQHYLRPCIYQALERAMSVAEREEVFELIRECASPFHSNRTAFDRYLGREGGEGEAREILSQLYSNLSTEGRA